MSHSKPLSQMLAACFSTVFIGLPGAGSMAQERYGASRDGDAAVECWAPSRTEIRPCIELPAPQACQTEANYPSTESREHAAATFINRSKDPLDLYWIDFDGHRKFYHTVPAASRYTQQTFAGHTWMLASGTTRQCLAVFRVGAE